MKTARLALFVVLATTVLAGGACAGVWDLTADFSMANGNPNGATARPPAPTPEDLAAIDRALADSQPVAGGAQ